MIVTSIHMFVQHVADGGKKERVNSKSVVSVALMIVINMNVIRVWDAIVVIIRGIHQINVGLRYRVFAMNKHYITVLNAAMTADIPVMMWGAPGIGKSSIIKSIAKINKLPCEIVVGSVREPSDFAGLPVVRDTTGDIPDVPLAPPDWAKRLYDAGEGVLFLDEITTAPPAVQAAMLRVVLDRSVGSLQLPSNIRIIAAGNPSDEAADGWDLAPPLANRFLHLEVSADVDVFINGMTTGWDSNIITPYVTKPTHSDFTKAKALVTAFISKRRELLHQLPKGEASAGKAWPSPRTWEMVSKIIPLIEDKYALYLAVSGLVGEGASVEFLTWLENNDLPNPESVLSDPSSVNWNDRTDKIFAITNSLVVHFSELKDEPEDASEVWEQTWNALAYAADNGPTDIVALSAKKLIELRQSSWRFPQQAKAFLTVLRDAGLTRQSPSR